VIATLGLVVIAGGFALWYVFRGVEGQATARAEWIDASLALLGTAAVGSGTLMIVAGVSTFFR
jgi:hypothetical protein